MRPTRAISSKAVRLPPVVWLTVTSAGKSSTLVASARACRKGWTAAKALRSRPALRRATKSGPANLAAAFAFANHWMSTDWFALSDRRLKRPELWRAARRWLPFRNALRRHHAQRGNGRDPADTQGELGARLDPVLYMFYHDVERPA